MDALCVSGGCYCGNVSLDVTLSREPATYNPRACDCDFCQKHGASYVSDPLGSLCIRIEDEREVSRYRQGSGTAELLLCRKCGVMVAAVYRDADEVFGTVNVRALDSRADFGAEVAVSPKVLSAQEKVTRWRGIWFGNVSVRGKAN